MTFDDAQKGGEPARTRPSGRRRRARQEPEQSREADDGARSESVGPQAAGISFDQLTRKVEKWIEVDEDREVPATKRELPPIEALEPSTFVRWRFKGTLMKMYAGQRYSFVFETDAAPSYWNPADSAWCCRR
jgi:hypothetical protein